MRWKGDGTWFWNTGQVKVRWCLALCLLLLYSNATSARPDFLDSMSRQFFGVQNDDSRQHNHHQQQRQDPDPFAQMFGSHSQPVQSRPPPPNHLHQRPPQRQGYYAPHPVEHHPHPQYQVHHQPQHYPVNYNGPPPVYGQQQGFGQVKTDGNQTKTEGFPRDGSQQKTTSPFSPHPRHPHVTPEYHIQHQPAAVEYHHPPNTAIEYHHQEPVEYHHQPPVEYHHAPPHQVEYHQPAVLEEHHGIEIHSDPHHHPHHEVVEYHHPPPVEYHHHHPTHKPKSFHLSFNQPSPDLKIIDKHLKLPPVKFRFHINPKILITTNTKDPLDKKHHDDEHDLEPYPPPDAFSDHEAPPSYSEHTIQQYPVVHHEHYPVVHHEVGKHYPIAYPEAKHYPVEHHAVAHHPPHEYTYDLSGGHSHVNPHRSSGHYEPTFKIKTRPIVFTEPPPTKPTTTPRPTTTTSRTTTTTTTTTARPTRSRSRARLNARNPGFSVAFTQGSTSATTSIERQGDASEATTSTTTTRRSIFGSNSEREKEGDGISARKDDQLTSTTSLQTPTTSTTSTTMKPATTTTTTLAPTTSSTTTTTTPATTTTTTTTPKPTTTSTTTTQRPTTTSTTTTTAVPTTTSTTKAPPTTRSTSNTPAEETTPRTTTTLNVGANEIDMRKTSESPRRRLEPLKEESLTTIERSESFNVESSESVKVIETTMLIDGKNQTVKFYYITQPVKLPLELFQKMTGQKSMSNGMSVVKIREKRFVTNLDELQPILNE